MESFEDIKKMMDEERLVLAKKLDMELVDDIDNLEKEMYIERFSEDTLEEEPFCIKNPMLKDHTIKFLQKINLSEEIASNYREHGNFNVKLKKFEIAVMNYTEAIKLKCPNTELNAVLYNNRSAAQFFLKNYRFSLWDAQKAYRLKPDYMKPRLRASQCAYALNKFELCMQICDEILQEENDNKKVLDMRKECVSKKILKEERDQRRLALEQKERDDALNKLLDTLKSRNIRFENVSLENLSEVWIRPKLDFLCYYPVSLSSTGSLLWPIIILFPESLTCDIHRFIDENVIFADFLNELYIELLVYDPEDIHDPNNTNLYYVNSITATVNPIDTSHTFKMITEQVFFNVIDGCLMFYLLTNNSTSERDFLDEKRIPRQTKLK